MKLNDLSFKNLRNVSGIYIIYNNINNKKYIGSSNNMYTRFINHKNKLINKCHENYKLQSDFNLHGIDNFTFEVILQCDKTELYNHEQLLLMDTCEKYNIQPNAYSNLGTHLSDKAKAIISVTHKGTHNGRSKLTTDQVNYIRESREKGIVLSKKFNISPAQISMVRNYKSYLN